MSKIKINYNLKTNDNLTSIESKGIKNNNTITFKDNDVMFKLKIEEDKLIINRSNDEYSIDLNLSLENSFGYYCLNNIGKFKLNIKTDQITLDENSIKIKYNLNDDLFELDLIYEVIE